MRRSILISTMLMSLSATAEDAGSIAEIVVTSERRPQLSLRHAGNIDHIGQELIHIANAHHISELLLQRHFGCMIA